MTTEHALLAALSTLLIAGLLIYLRREFEQIAFQARVDEYLSKDQIFYNYTDGIMVKPAQPKRRKYRDKL